MKVFEIFQQIWGAAPTPPTHTPNLGAYIQHAVATGQWTNCRFHVPQLNMSSRPSALHELSTFAESGSASATPRKLRRGSKRRVENLRRPALVVATAGFLWHSISNMQHTTELLHTTTKLSFWQEEWGTLPLPKLPARANASLRPLQRHAEDFDESDKEKAGSQSW